jgi:hypothetical protein
MLKFIQSKSKKSTSFSNRFLSYKKCYKSYAKATKLAKLQKILPLFLEFFLDLKPFIKHPLL